MSNADRKMFTAKSGYAPASCEIVDTLKTMRGVMVGFCFRLLLGDVAGRRCFNVARLRFSLVAGRRCFNAARLR